PAEKHGGSLVQLSGSYGCNLLFRKGSFEFSAIKVRKRGKQLSLKPGEWQEVSLVLGKEAVVVKVDDQTCVIENKAGQSFLSNEIRLGDKLDAEIKDVKIYSGPVTQ
ncbi:MAG: hypothetical protein ACYTGH_13100, partial [Planctomycetota bacterium]